MKLNKESLKEFKELYLKEYGIKLDDERAYAYATRLISLVKIVYENNLPEGDLTKGVKTGYHENGGN